MSRSLIFVLVALMVLAAIPQEAAGYNPYERAWMFITYPPGEYGIGDTVSFTVHVVEEGEYIRPDSIEIKRYRSDPLDYEEVAIGRYRVDYRITDEDTEGPNPGFSIQAEARLNRTDWMGDPVDIILQRSFGINFPRPFELDLSIDDVADKHPSPNDTVEFSITTLFKGEPVDLEDPPYAHVSFNMSTWARPLVIRSGTGLYKGSFEVPSMKAGLVTISASGTYYEGSDRYGASDRERISVELIQVWGRVVDVLPYKSTVELVLTDADGAPVEGADVDLEWSYWKAAWNMPKTVNGITDATGKVTLLLRYPDLDEEGPNIIVDGVARWGNLTQRFQGNLWVQDFQHYSSSANWELDVIVHAKQPIPLGGRVELEHSATLNGTAIADGELVVYVWDNHTLHYAGRVRTDAQGRFTVPLDVPAALPGDARHAFFYARYQYDLDGQMRSDFKYLTIGDYSRWDRFDRHIDPTVTLSVEPYAVNRSLEVSLRHQGADGTDETAYLLWGIGPVPVWTDFDNLAWESWNHKSTNALRTVPLNWSGGSYRGSIDLPDFLTESTEIFIYGVMEFKGGDEPSMALRGGLTPLVTNLAPTIEVIEPVPGESYSGTLACAGTSSDDRSVARVETRLDGGQWMVAQGTTAWSLDIDTGSLGDGSHTLEVRAYDGYLFSDTVSVTFDVHTPEDDPDLRVEGPFTIMFILVAVGIIALGMGLASRRSRRVQ